MCFSDLRATLALQNMGYSSKTVLQAQVAYLVLSTQTTLAAGDPITPQPAMLCKVEHEQYAHRQSVNHRQCDVQPATTSSGSHLVHNHYSIAIDQMTIGRMFSS